MTISIPKYRLEKSLGHLAARFSRVVLRRINIALAQEGLPITADQYSFLIQLWERNGLPQGVLAEKTVKDKTTMARLAAGLESIGLIVRVPSTTDARERLVFLSDEGKRIMDRATLLVREIIGEAQQGIDEAQLETCRDVLRRACSNLLK
ncbi:MarR family winged helix-turn-helix transcriptional regulator [Geobacter sp. SVR]|uniref:MarR family winged helix-turn-helix transcriptional regulator n=1 Tax=Geobacter sp. SVR TaxID=2495594 RepID=UPI00143EF9CF|nr:MarR family transcriptional regulator [Geobacter sp. SVR]BCS55385.1 MarR family transcriptional regulator [Geobacter sp. SVR]GCF87308.1 MarR family transcriptional regulator [Geobacter sp. SVR]